MNKAPLAGAVAAECPDKPRKPWWTTLFIQLISYYEIFLNRNQQEPPESPVEIPRSYEFFRSSRPEIFFIPIHEVHTFYVLFFWMTWNEKNIRIFLPEK
jgi:hypothetical protein